MNYCKYAIKNDSSSTPHVSVIPFFNFQVKIDLLFTPYLHVCSSIVLSLLLVAPFYWLVNNIIPNDLRRV